MKKIEMLLIASVFGLYSGMAPAADATLTPPKNPVMAKRIPHHPGIKDCHPGYGHGMGHGHGMGYGHGMMGGYGGGEGYGHGMMGGMGVKLLGPRTAIVQSLDLSKAQRDKITRLIDKLQHDNWATMGTIIDDSGVLRDLYHADRRDSVAIDKTYQKIFDLKRQMIKAALDTENEIEDALTPDQLKQLRDRLHQSPPFAGQ